MAKGINTAFSNAQRVRVGDYGSTLEIELKNSEEAEVQEVEWVRIYSVDKPEIIQFIEAEDFTVENNTVYIILPDIPRGQYNIEIKDDVGRLYPAEGAIRLQMVQSTNEAVEVYYVNYRDLILEDATPIIEDYLISNSDVFRGEKGDAFTWEDFTEEQKQELKGLDGANGINGLSAYELASGSGFDGPVTEWLDSLKGIDGKDGERGSDGEDGLDGKDFVFSDFTTEQLEDLKLKIVDTEFDSDGNTLVTFTDGSSFTVNKGEQGEEGDKGDDGLHGNSVSVEDNIDGAYDIINYNPNNDTELYRVTVKNGIDGKDFVFTDFTEEQLEDLKLKVVDTEFDPDGNTALTLNDGTQFVVNKGERGLQGEQGIQGKQGPQGTKGDEGEDGYTPIKGVDYFDGAKGDKGDKGDPGDTSVIIEEHNAYDSDYTDYPLGTITMFPVSFFAGFPLSGTLTTVNLDDGHLYQELQQYEWHTKATRYLSWSGEWSDWTSLDGTVLKSVNEASPLTDYPYGESVKMAIGGQGWSLGDGTVKTIRSTNLSNFGRQLFFPKDNDNIYTRRELDGGWTDWKQIQMVD